MPTQRVPSQEVSGFLPPLILSTEVVIPLLIGGGLVAIALYAKRFGKLSSVQGGLLNLGGLSIALAASLWLAAAIPLIVTFYIPALFASPWIALAAALLGLTLWAIRRKWLAAYGGLEVIAALGTIGICAFTQYGSFFERGIALLGAIYFLVRGLDNAEKGALLNQLSRVPMRVWKLVILVFLGSALVMAVAAVRSEPSIDPPYLGGVHGEVVPVPATHCGRPFVVCDVAAWLENERLRTAPASERDRAEREFNRRYARVVCSQDKKSTLVRASPEWCASRGHSPERDRP